MAKQSKFPKTVSPNPKPISPIEAVPNQWLPGLLLAIFAFLLYANTLNHGWALDDYSVIKDNYVTQQGTKGIGTLMTTEYRYGYWNSPGSLYRPLSLVMFAMEWQIMPDNPFIGHFVNVFLYAFTALILFFTLSNVLKNNNLAIPFVITALYVAHPTHVEVVANIKSRDELLAMLFAVATINFILKYIDFGKLSSLIAALLCYAIALFSKESAITFLAIFPLVIHFFRSIELSQNIKISLFFLAPALLFLMVRSMVLGNQTVLDDISPLDNIIVQAGQPKLAGALAMMLYYLKSIFFPLTMVSDLGFNAVTLQGWGDWKVWVSVLIFGGLLAYAVRGFSKKDPVAFGILFFFVTFSISSNIFLTIGTSYGERLVYMSSLGAMFSFVFLMYKTFKTSDLNQNLFSFLSKSSIFSSIIFLFIVGFSLRTITRNPAWKDSYTLYETDAENGSKSAKLLYHYGLELTKKGRDTKDPATKNGLIEKAVSYFEQSISIYPNYKDVYGEMGLAYFYKGDNQKAMENYNKAVAIQPDAKVYSNMGMILVGQSHQEAQKVYEKALSIDPRYVDGLQNLGAVLCMQGKFKEAIPHFQNAINYSPNRAILHFYLGSAIRDSGDAAAAQVHFNKAYQLDPKLRK